jgi:acetyltransferase
MYIIESLKAEKAQVYLTQLIGLLKDTVESDASIGFLPPLEEEAARNYWSKTIEEISQEKRLLLAAIEKDQLIGSVQLEFAGKQNAMHRAEVQKLMVHRQARNKGVGRILMTAIEDAARDAGRTLLVLDTRRGDTAERLYQKLGYTIAGIIPQYALSANGKLSDTVFFYKIL